jgi:hypothetical protein
LEGERGLARAGVPRDEMQVVAREAAAEQFVQARDPAGSLWGVLELGRDDGLLFKYRHVLKNLCAAASNGWSRRGIQ